MFLLQSFQKKKSERTELLQRLPAHFFFLTHRFFPNVPFFLPPPNFLGALIFCGMSAVGAFFPLGLLSVYMRSYPSLTSRGRVET